MQEASPAGARFGGAKANAVMREPGLLRLVCDRGCKELVSLNPCQCLGESPSRKLAGGNGQEGRGEVFFWGGRVSIVRGGGHKSAVGETGKRPKAVNCQYCRGGTGQQVTVPSDRSGRAQGSVGSWVSFPVFWGEGGVVAIHGSVQGPRQSKSVEASNRVGSASATVNSGRPSK